MSAKRENNNVIISASTLILDIEGTTSAISFVKDELFPYVRKNLESFVNKNWDSSDFQKIVNALKAQAKEDEEKKVEGTIVIPESEEKEILFKALVDNVVWQMDNDRKTKSLKDLQGMIMEEGFMKGELKGHVYDDVEPSLKFWTEQDKSVYIYSSGSVHAQKLLFRHSEKGDLLPFIKGHFDTTVGMKSEVASYKKILSEISCSAIEVAFLTDVIKEARAAKEAGISAIILSREGNFPLTEDEKSEFPVITSFEEIEFNHTSKKRKICADDDVKKDNKPVTTCAVSDNKPNEPELTTNNDVEMMEVDRVEDTNTIETKENATRLCDEKEEFSNSGTTKQNDPNGVCNVESDIIVKEDVCEKEVDDEKDKVKLVDKESTEINENTQKDTIPTCKTDETSKNADMITNKKEIIHVQSDIIEKVEDVCEKEDDSEKDKIELEDQNSIKILEHTQKDTVSVCKTDETTENANMTTETKNDSNNKNIESIHKDNDESVTNTNSVTDVVIVEKEQEKNKETKKSEEGKVQVENQDDENSLLKKDSLVQVSESNTDIQDSMKDEIKNGENVTVDSSEVFEKTAVVVGLPDSTNKINETSVVCEKLSNAITLETETIKPPLEFKEKGLIAETSVDNVTDTGEMEKVKDAEKHSEPGLIQINENTEINATDIRGSETQHSPAVKKCDLPEKSSLEECTRSVNQSQEKENTEKNVPEKIVENGDKINEMLPGTEIISEGKEKMDVCGLETLNHVEPKELISNKKMETEMDNHDNPSNKSEIDCEKTEVPEKLSTPTEECDTTKNYKTETTATISKIESNDVVESAETKVPINETDVLSVKNNEKIDETTSQCKTEKIPEPQKLNDTLQNGEITNGDSKNINSVSSPDLNKTTHNTANVNGTSSCQEKKCDAPENSLETVVEA